MGVLKKVIILLSTLVLLAALVWQWTRSVDLQGKISQILMNLVNNYLLCRVLQGEEGNLDWGISWHWQELGHPTGTAWG